MRLIKGKNLEDIQKMNRDLLVRYLINGEVTSRVALAKKTNLKQATISNIINEFIDWGLVTEIGIINNGIGRPIRGIRFCNERFWIIAVRLSRNYVQAAVLDLAGNFFDHKQYPIDNNKVELPIIIENLIVQLNQILESHRDKHFLGISLAIPGPWIRNERKLAFFPGFNKWQDLDIGDAIEKKVGLRVFIEHDTHVALMAESQFHSWGFDKQLVLWVALGQGIGSAIYSNGEILQGNIGIAGEIGHMSINPDGIPCECGNVGCLERYVSTLTIVKSVHARIGSNPSALNKKSAIEDIIAAYKERDTIAVDCINEAAICIGHALASLSNVLNPGVIILGDELSTSGESFLQKVRKAFGSRVTAAVRKSTEISLSDVKKNPYLLGGGQVVIEGCLAIPDFFVNIKNKKEQNN
jgi:predicted NBD/HSP70 family sugar kinase